MRNLVGALIAGAAVLTMGSHAAASVAPSRAPVFHPPGYAACSAALDTMSLDRKLDGAAAIDYPNYADTYHAAVVRWTTDIAQITAVCAKVCVIGVSLTPPSSTQRYTAEVGFAGAIDSHVKDERAWPTSAAWDNLWISRYVAMTAFYEEL